MDADSPSATFRNSFNLARTEDASFVDVCKHAVNVEIAVIKAAKHQELNDALRTMPDKLKGINLRGLKMVIDKAIPVCAI